MIALGETFAKDFALMAIIQTTNLMVNSYLKNQLFFLF
jgi:hypothetical protein